MVLHPSRHELFKSSRLCFGGAEFLHHRANRLSKYPRFRDGGVQQEHLLLLTNLCELKPQMALCGHRASHRMPHGTCSVLGGSQSQVSGPAQLLDRFRSQTSPFVHLFEDIRLVGLEDGHSVKGHACLTSRDVGLPDMGGCGPTWLSRKEGTRLARRCQGR